MSGRFHRFEIGRAQVAASNPGRVTESGSIGRDRRMKVRRVGVGWNSIDLAKALQPLGPF